MGFRGSRVQIPPADNVLFGPAVSFSDRAVVLVRNEDTCVFAMPSHGVAVR